jgi:hypothetical protein
MDPNERGDARISFRIQLRQALPQGLERFLGKLLIDLLIGLICLLSKNGSIRHGVEERPERCIAATVVIEVKFGGVKENSLHLL